MKIFQLFLFISSIFLISCNKENLDTIDNQPELLNETLAKNLANNFNIADKTMGLPNGNGLQKINDNQTNDALERGVGVSIPLFSTDTEVVKTGSWVTLRFGLLDLLVEGSDCPEELTQEQIDFILEDAIQYEEESDFSVFFDGTRIDLASYYRTEGITTVYGTLDGITGCYYRIPWRYYVNPQSKGDHEFKCIFGEDEYVRTIRWDNKK